MKNIKKPVIAYVHTHFDPEWYRSADSFNVRLNEIVDNVLSEIKSENIPSFYFDGQILALLNYLEFNPLAKNQIKKLIKEKKLFIGPFFVSADNFLTPLNAMVKNLEFGLKISKEFGESEFIGYLSDTFGHSSDMFKLLNAFNIDKSIVWRGIPKGYPADFLKSDVKTTRLVFGYYQDIFHSRIDKNKILQLENILDKISANSNEILLLPLGGDHLSPPKELKSKIDFANKNLKNYEIKLSDIFEYFKNAKYEKKSEDEFLDNSETYILQGVYSTRADEKILNKKLCYELFNKIIPFNYFIKGKYSKELNYATTELLKNQAHDSIYGCSLDLVSRAVKNRQDSVSEIINAVKSSLVRDFKKKNLISDTTHKIGVFNFSNYPQKGVVKVISDKKIKNGDKIRTFYSVSEEIMSDTYKNPMTEDFHNFYEYLIETPVIEPFSFKNFEIKEPHKTQIAGDDFIENENLKLFILDKKIIVIDKIKNEMYEDFISFYETGDNGDSYNFSPTGYPKKIDLIKSKRKTNGKIKSTLEIKFRENITLDVSLYNSSKNFEFEIDINNKKKNRKIQIGFNTKNNISKTIAKDLIGEVIREHKNPGYLLFENLPAKNRGEAKTGAYPNQGYVFTNNVFVGTDGLIEYEVYKNELKITLLRSIGIISNPKNKARIVPAGPPVECPSMQMIGSYKMKLYLAFDNLGQKFLENSLDSFIGILGEFKIKNKTFIKNDEKSYFSGIVENKPLFIS